MENTPEFVTVEKFAKLTGFLEKLSKRLDSIEKSIKGIDQRVKKIEDHLDSNESESSSDESDRHSNYGFGPKPVENPRHPSGESYTLEVSHGPFTIYREQKDDDAGWEKRKKGLMYCRIKFLNSSGVTGTPEQEEYLRELREDMEKWKTDPRNPDFRVDATRSNCQRIGAT